MNQPFTLEPGQIAREQDIGLTTKETFDVTVQNFSVVIEAISTATAISSEMAETLRKIKTGIDLILCQEVEEAE